MWWWGLATHLEGRGPEVAGKMDVYIQLYIQVDVSWGNWSFILKYFILKEKL